MIYYENKEDYVLGVYVSDAIENPDYAIRRVLGLQDEKILTPQQMSDSSSMMDTYILSTTKKIVYSHLNFFDNDVYIYLEKSLGRVLVCIRHSINSEGDFEEAHSSIEQLVTILSKEGFRPVESRIEDIPDMCFV